MLDVKLLLERASAHDKAARELRREAGKELAALRSERPLGWHKLAQVDKRTGELLINLSAGL